MVRADMQYVFDTNIYSNLAKGFISEVDLPPFDGQIISTNVQLHEVMRTRDTRIRDKIVAKYEEFSPKIVPTETFAWGVSHWGVDKWSDGSFCGVIKSDLDALERKENNFKDAL